MFVTLVSVWLLFLLLPFLVILRLLQVFICVVLTRSSKPTLPQNIIEAKRCFLQKAFVVAGAELLVLGFFASYESSEESKSNV